ncbi:MAG: hypothetical protein A3J04_00990 [Candidatus Ryanbacteria bacterium RIFCSPLOWO2_02_FULL_47_14]|uniref:Plasmid stabilization protein n=1 Tax=Candidatus Ryanbacteria bacterium RIFCSPLOWO2_02_FULL_47_14 TaxID=1802129 RepID=A0A1G2H3P7_9BACT|nr:MAG: hypothetical protein A3J04_00990 [Candidatus Ryanbacteria bacterium RIFCSPLOWO2_02_FULL_47_14]
MRLSLTYSAYREMEQIPGVPLRAIGAAILALSDNPMPPGSAVLKGRGGCLYISIDGYNILYHVGQHEEEITVLGVVDESLRTLH